MKLSFAFPFYGTEVDTVTVTSAGAVLIGDPSIDDGVMVLPSHVAAFLTSMPREAKDTVEFADSRCTIAIVQKWAKRRALGCEKSLPGPARLFLSKTGPPFRPYLNVFLWNCSQF